MNTRHLLPLVLTAGLAMPAVALATPDQSLSFTPLGSYAADWFSDESSAAEIVAHDSRTQRLFVVNGHERRIDVLSVKNPAAPTLLFSIDCTPHGDQPNSVAVHKGVVAVAVQAPVKTDPGSAVFFDTDGRFLARVQVGALPDMITFTPDGQFALTANEGEPNDAYTVDPEGSVSIIDVRGNLKKLKQSDVRTATFTAFNGATLDPSVRVFGPGATVAQDLEPEYITVSRDSRTAYVTLQEANAIARVDIRSARVTAIRGLGFKDHGRVDAVAELFEFDPSILPSIGTTDAGQSISLGGFSGLAFEGIDAATGRYRFITHTDRGPNGEPTGILRPFLLPDFAPEVVRFELDRESGAIAITQRLPLQRAPGMPLTGLPNLSLGTDANQAYNDEIGVDLFGAATGVDPLGADLEGIVVAADGSFWMCDEYRPALYHFSHDGVLIQRYVPIGTAAAAGQPEGTYGAEILPAVLAQRRQNRGFEAIALDNGRIYAWVQSPARNPVTTPNGVLNASRNVRLVEVNLANLTAAGVRQFLYVMDNPVSVGVDDTRADKLGDAVALGGGEFLLIERDDDSSTSDPADPAATNTKRVYRLNLAGATELTAAREATLFAATGKTPDQATIAELTANGINPVGKVLQVDLVAAGYDTTQKVEGIAVIDPWTIAVINDNDFQVAGIDIDEATGTFTYLPNYVPEPVTLGLIDMIGQGLDASDREISSSQGRINIRPRPVHGIYMPDAIASFETCGREYLISANEGDSRDYDGFAEEARVNALTLDPVAFPFGNTLKNNAQLGRLTVTRTLGDTDGDGDFDALHALGARSFTIWSTKGELVFDSGELLEQVVANDPVFKAIFNAGHTTNALDDRSDNKGPEPEAVAIGRIGARTYAFIGLERIGGFMVFDVSEPAAPVFVDYVNNRDPAAAPGLDNGSDYGLESLIFIDAKDSPVRAPLVITANDVSGTTTVFRIDVSRECGRGGPRGHGHGNGRGHGKGNDHGHGGGRR